KSYACTVRCPSKFSQPYNIHMHFDLRPHLRIPSHGHSSHLSSPPPTPPKKNSWH
ncbi:hypothetical protein IscW_ISCW005739, partial [Ixodes scapularis]